MVKVDYFRTEVNYTGRFDEYTLEDWKAKAIAKQDRGIDCFNETREETEGFAKVIDGKFLVDNKYPSNKIAVVSWAHITYEEDEEA